MITIKISADNERLINNAQTEAELRGVRELILERIEQSKAVKAASKRDVSVAKEASPYNWREVVSSLRDWFAPEELIFPESPDPAWYTTVQRYAKMHKLDRAGVGRLAQAIMESYLRPPFRVQWLVWNADSILAGKYKKGTPPMKPNRYSPDYSSTSRTPQLLPDD